MGVSQEWRSPEHLERITELTGLIPLLICHCINLISHGHSLNEIEEIRPGKETVDEGDWEEALDFMCRLQWDDLQKESKKLLTGIAFWGGDLSFSEAKMLCAFSDKRFRKAKAELQDRSFLVDHTLIESKLTLLPPIGRFARVQLSNFPAFEKEFLNRESILRTSEKDGQDVFESLSDTMAINYLFQRAEYLAKSGSIREGYDWCKQATERFPRHVLSWRRRGEFEYRYLEDDLAANESFRSAVELDPKNHVTYNTWAYWEYMRGVEDYSKVRLRKSIRFNLKALAVVYKEEDKKRITDYVASAYMKLGYIARDEVFRSPSRKTETERDRIFTTVIRTLEENLYEDPDTDFQIHHNVIDYNIIATAFLSMGKPRSEYREAMDESAVFYLGEGFKLDSTNRELRFTSKHPGVIKSLSRHGFRLDREDEEQIVETILENQKKFSKARGIVEGLLKRLQ